MPNFVPRGEWKLVEGHTGRWYYDTDPDLTIFGVGFSIEAIEVADVNGVQVAVDPKCSEDFVYLGLLSTTDGHFETTKIDGKDALVFFVPLCQ